MLSIVGVPTGLVIASIHERRDELRAALKSKDEGSERERAPEFRGAARRERSNGADALPRHSEREGKSPSTAKIKDGRATAW